MNDILNIVISRQCSSGLWYCVVLETDTTILEEHISPSFTVVPEHDGIIFLQKYCIDLQDYIISQGRAQYEH